MTSQEFQDALRKRPFQPFRIVQTDGTTYDIRHPEMVLLGLTSAVLGLNVNPEQTLYARTVTVDLMHVIRLEQLPAPSQTKSNGQG